MLLSLRDAIEPAHTRLSTDPPPLKEYIAEVGPPESEEKSVGGDHPHFYWLLGGVYLLQNTARKREAWFL